ncbi:MAG: replicative DNA helicase [Candidatus Hydrothermia bacterium]|nr:replicative DNA helicase [Candidatus Hydrothermia bacterium]
MTNQRKKTTPKKDLNQIGELPFSREVEMSVLGAMLMNEEALFKGLETLKEEDFYIDAHKKIFKTILEIFETHKNVDPLTLTEELKKMEILEEVGGPEYIMAIIESVISPALIDNHCKILLEKSVYRKIIENSTEILKEAFSSSMPADELLDYAEQEILSIREREVRKSFIPMEILVTENVKMIEHIRASGSNITGVPSGFADLDTITSGFQKGDLVIVASRPSQGKTSLALSVMRYLGVELGKPTAMFSLEMPMEQIGLRLLCMQSRIDMSRLRKGMIKDEEFEKITIAAGQLKKAPIYIDDTPSIPILELRAKARRIKREHNVEAIFVDYLQLVQGPENSENRQQEISGISRSLKALAKELQIPVIALSQLSRAIEQRADKRPQLSDLRESGAIEQDADLVIFLHKQKGDEDMEFRGIQAPLEDNTVDVIIGKHRNGPIGELKLTFIKEYVKFENYAPIPLDF